MVPLKIEIHSWIEFTLVRYESFLNERSEADYAMYDYGNASDYRKDLKMVMEYAYKASHNAIPLFYEAPQPIKNLVNSLKTKLPDYMLQVYKHPQHSFIECFPLNTSVSDHANLWRYDYPMSLGRPKKKLFPSICSKGTEVWGLLFVQHSCHRS